MAREDLIKYRDLLLNDSDFQKKFLAAAEKYDGDKDEKAVFDKVVLPLGKEYGLSATYEEFKEYTDTFASKASAELSEDELAQVAGGKGGGLGVGKCMVFGVGIGGGGAIEKSQFGHVPGYGLCIGIGAGVGQYGCAGSGTATEI